MDNQNVTSNASLPTSATAKYSFLNVAMLMFFCGVVGNLIALVILFRSKSSEHSKTVFQILIKALVLNDVTFIILTSIPPQLAYANNMTWQGGIAACHYHASAMLCAGLTTPFLITIMSLERALCLSWWHFYVQHMTKRRAVTIVVVSIVIAAGFSLLPVVGVGRTVLQARGSWCFLDLHSRRLVDRVYSFAYAFQLTLCITVSLTANVYVIVTLLRYRKVRKEIVRECSYVSTRNRNRVTSVPENDLRLQRRRLKQGARSLSLPVVVTQSYRHKVSLTLSANCRKHSKSLLRAQFPNETGDLQLVTSRQPDQVTRNTNTNTNTNTTPSYRLKDLELQMVILLFVLTVVFTVCWTPLTAQIFMSVFDAHNEQFLLAIRMASFNQLIDPWCYVVLRIGAVVRIFSFFRRVLRDCMQPQLSSRNLSVTRKRSRTQQVLRRLERALQRKDKQEQHSESTCDCMCDCPCHLRNPAACSS